MNKIAPLQLPSLRAEVLSTGVILEPKKGALLSLEDMKNLWLWCEAFRLANLPDDVPSVTEEFPLYD